MEGSANPIEHNRQAWDQRAREGRVFTRPISDEELADARKAIDGWALAEGIVSKRILCLACGGGRQGPAYSKHGGIVTVVDISDAQLEIDRQLARKHLLDLRTVRGSMDDLSMFGDGAFDIVIQPVSTCYVPDIGKVYREVARVTAAGGLYISQHKQPVSLQADTARSTRGYEIVEPYYRTEPLPQVQGSIHREHGTLEYLHRWEQLIGNLCRAGFVIEDAAEPNHSDPASRPGTFGDRSRYIPPYIRLKARRVAGENKNASPSILRV